MISDSLLNLFTLKNYKNKKRNTNRRQRKTNVKTFHCDLTEKKISRRCSQSLKCQNKNEWQLNRESILYVFCINTMNTTYGLNSQMRKVSQGKRMQKSKAATKQIASRNVYVSKLSTSIYSYVCRLYWRLQCTVVPNA